MFYSLFTTLLDLVICAFLLRVLLQLVKANFYNPISQLIWKVTQPVVMPLVRLVPRIRNIDTPAVLMLAVVAVLDIWIVASIYGQGLEFSQMLGLAALKVISLGLRIYILSLLVVTILSWVGPGVSNPAANVLWSLTEPVLKPVRRVIPLVAGLDLSPIPVMILFQALDTWMRTLLGLFH
ncbi:YggT family protein [Nevskia sp.]|uniref:YggT family protein n=1 Tax=Nevskia sp. TaxID=1929292 RepID=UPI0025F274CC|nr:YggT family protein [Nevskia sp.]